MKFTGSGFSRVVECPASAVLPQTRTTNRYSSFGNIVHAYLSDVNALGEGEALLRVPKEHREAIGAINIEQLPAVKREAFVSEVAFAYDPETDTARELGRRMTREEAYKLAKPGEVCGTVDVVGVTDDAVVVPDYKSGWSDLGEVKNNRTMRFYGLCAARAYGKEKAFIATIRTRPNEEPFWDRAEMDALDLDATAVEVRRAREMIQREEDLLASGRPINLHQGEHCTYCPAFNSCPAKMNLIREVALAVTGGGVVTPPVLNESNFPAMWNRLELMEDVLKRTREILEDFTRVRPVPVGGGEVVGPRPYPRDTLDPAITELVVKEMIGAAAASAELPNAKDIAADTAKAALVVEVTTGKGLIEAAIRGAKKRIPGLVIGKFKDRVIEEIRKRGGIKTKVSYPVSRHTPKALKGGNDAAGNLPATNVG